jgi:hypothetical protein
MARKQAIIDRRANDPSFEPRETSPSNIALANGNGNSSSPNLTSSTARQIADSNGHIIELSKAGATEATLQELLKQFSSVRLLRKLANGESIPQGQNALTASIANAVRAMSSSIPGTRHDQLGDTPGNIITNSTPQNMFATPPQINSKADEGPFKAEMIARMESVKRGDRIMPPCDRCRRLHMDCIKNLTACQGCTKKHAKCSWKEVRLEELTNYSNIPNHSNNIFATELAGGPGPSNVDLEAVAKASSAALDATEAELRRGHHAVQDQHSSRYAHTSPNAPYESFAHTSVNMPFASVSGRRESMDDVSSSELRHADGEMT